jgi:hypothetical protein
MLRSFQTVSRETVRKVSDAPTAQSYGPPKWGFSAHFAPCIPAKLKVGALLIPLFRTVSRRGIPRSPYTVICIAPVLTGHNHRDEPSP